MLLSDFLFPRFFVVPLANPSNFSHCKCFSSRIPPRAVVNGLETAPLPDELKWFDAFSLQLIQLAKTFQTVIRLHPYSKKVPSYNCLKACRGNMFILPLPMANTAETLALNECGLPKPQLYVKVDGVPTKKNVLWWKFVDINKIEGALTKLKEINWLYVDVQPGKVEQSMEDVVIEVANSATSTMLEKVTDKSGYTAGIQAYTVRSLDTFKPNVADIDQFKMLKVDEYPLKSSQEHLDVMCFPNLFPTGRFGEFHPRDEHLSFSEYVKSRLNNKDSRYRKSSEYLFYLTHQKLLRKIKAGIFNVLKNTTIRHSPVKDLLKQLEKKRRRARGKPLHNHA